MKCPFCGSHCTSSTRFVSNKGTVPMLEYYFWCKEKIECGWASKYLLDYIGTTSPSKMGIIDKHTGKVLLLNEKEHPNFENGIIKHLSNDSAA